MKKLLTVCTLLALLSAPASALQLSGDWTTGFVFGSGSLTSRSALTLQLDLSGWALTGTWSFTEAGLGVEEFSFQGWLGPLGIDAGASFRTTPDASARWDGGTGWALDGLELTGGYMSFQLELGRLTLGLTLSRALLGE